MYPLVLAILFTSWLLIAFRVFAIFRIQTLQAIIINYMVCSVTGLLFFRNYEKISSIQFSETWFSMALLTGFCFLPIFFLMAYSVQKTGVGITTLASKTSLIIPVSVSLLYLNEQATFEWTHSLGLTLGIGAIVMTSADKISFSSTSPNRELLLPFLVFLGAGLIDVLINISNYKFLPADKSSLFPLVAFSASACTGLCILLYRFIAFKEKIVFKNIAGGILLGIPNYLSIYFLLEALQDFGNNGALVFPLLNIGIILLTAVVAFFFFQEKPGKYNSIGLAMAIAALLLLI
jgi:drug/metabolite transporter (DMT)-like permease